jgi:hypothetical protein
MEDSVQFELHGTLVSSHASGRVLLPVHLLKVCEKKRLALAAHALGEHFGDIQEHHWALYLYKLQMSVSMQLLPEVIRKNICASFIRHARAWCCAP